MPPDLVRLHQARSGSGERASPTESDIHWGTMGRKSGNKKVVKALQDALTDFLEDQRRFAETDPEWLSERTEWSPEERKSEVGCGCDDCELAGQLRGSI